MRRPQGAQYLNKVQRLHFFTKLSSLFRSSGSGRQVASTPPILPVPPPLRQQNLHLLINSRHPPYHPPPSLFPIFLHRCSQPLDPYPIPLHSRTHSVNVTVVQLPTGLSQPEPQTCEFVPRRLLSLFYVSGHRLAWQSRQSACTTVQRSNRLIERVDSDVVEVDGRQSSEVVHRTAGFESWKYRLRGRILSGPKADVEASEPGLTRQDLQRRCEVRFVFGAEV